MRFRLLGPMRSGRWRSPIDGAEDQRSVAEPLVIEGDCLPRQSGPRNAIWNPVMTKKIAILGTGANGSCMAADLIEAGDDGTRSDQWLSHI